MREPSLVNATRPYVLCAGTTFNGLFVQVASEWDKMGQSNQRIPLHLGLRSEFVAFSLNGTYDYHWNDSVEAANTAYNFYEENSSHNTDKVEEYPTTIEESIPTTGTVADAEEEEEEIDVAAELVSSSNYFFEPVLSPNTWHFVCLSYDELKKSVQQISFWHFTLIKCSSLRIYCHCFDLVFLQIFVNISDT